MGKSESKLTTSLSEQASDQESDVTSANVIETTSHFSTTIKTNDQPPLEPIQVITRQTADESIYILRGKHGDSAAWHVILMSYGKRVNLSLANLKPFIQVEDFGRNIEYRDRSGAHCQASGYGAQPPAELMTWINENYDPCTIDESTTLTYTEDDIRLCTIHKAKFMPSSGIIFHYHRHEQFHYIRLSDDHCSTLAGQAGIKSFDRVIEYNGLNIEGDPAGSLKNRTATTDESVLQLLVCSPATYTYYKKSGQRMHSSLNTVRHYRPVRDVHDPFGPACGAKDFCAIRWENSHNIDVVPLAMVCVLSHCVQMYETCVVQSKGWQNKGQIIFLGAQDECEPLQFDAVSQSVTLISTEENVNESGAGHFQEIDDALFVTAYQHFTTETPDSQPPSSNQSVVDHGKREAEQKSRVCERENLIEQLVMSVFGNANNVRNKNELHHTRCHGCAAPEILGDRYRCLECCDYDLCGECFTQRCQTLKHLKGHAMVRFSAPNEIFGESVIDLAATVTLRAFRERYLREEHIEVACSICKMGPIKGLRFKCNDCHDYHLCTACMDKRQHDQSHPLLAIGKCRFLEIPVDDIELGDELGRGGFGKDATIENLCYRSFRVTFGTVYKARWLSANRQVACKVISVFLDHTHLEKSFRKELAAYAELSAPSILQTYGYNIQELANGTRRCMLVMEYMARGSLSAVLKQHETISLRRKLEMACQIASGMRRLHAHQMIHRDIRPDNILVAQDYTAKIGDMGLARVWLPDENMTLVGCTPYMPLDFYTGKYNQSLDVYTFGLTINQLFTERRHQFDLLTRRVQLASTSPVFADLIARCIHTESSQRPSAYEIETTLRTYREVIERYIFDKDIRYVNMSAEEKNIAFLTTYQTLRPTIEKILQHKFALARSQSATAVESDSSKTVQL